MDDGGFLLGTRTINDPDHYCAGQVGFPVSLTDRLGHIIAAIAVNRPSSDTTCVGVTACWDTPTPTATGTSTPTPTPTPIEPYIVLNRACSPVGEPVDIRASGYNWAPDPNKHILLEWWGPGDHYKDRQTLESRASWTLIFGLEPQETIAGTHTVRALQVETGEEDIKYLEVPCPATPTPTITATPLRPDLYITDIVGPSSPIAAYQPVTFTVTIKNDGPGDAFSLFWVDLYDLPNGSDSPTAGQSDGDVAWTAVSSLGAEDTKTVVLYYSFIDSEEARDVYGYVDTRQNVDEINEANNASKRLDLTISAGTPPSSTLTTDPVCSAEGVTTTITVRGEGWPDTGIIQILYDGNPDPKVSFSSRPSWNEDITISGAETLPMVPYHTIQAIITGTSYMQTQGYYIPCSEMATIDGYTWIFIKGDIVPHGRTDVYCYDDDGNLIAQTTSDDDSYYNMKIPPGGGPYTVIGETYIDDVLYKDAKAGVPASVGDTTTVNLVLIPQY
ncbi:MAG: hypothetical protein E3J21_02045 [Anaerolineales bacterium]|nr:MAG: hypothetical protein E3J21_02045 [Anaerolineales bacterium]